MKDLTFADEEKFSILNAGVALDVLDVVFVNIFGVVDESVFFVIYVDVDHCIDVNVYANVGFKDVRI